MQAILKAAVVFCFFLAIFLLAIGVDIKETYRKVKVGVDRVTGIFDLVASREGLLGRIISYTELMIQKSNIRLYVGYNVWAHFLFCLIFAATAFRWISQYMSLFASLSFAVVTAFIPYVLLQIITDIIKKREKRITIDFLIIFKSCFQSGSNDLFEAFENVTEFILEPLKSYIELMVFEYKHKINALICLENLKQKLSTSDLKIYMDNLKVCYVQGGNIIALTDTFIQEISNQDEDDDKQDVSDRILNYGLYALLFINFLIIRWTISSSYKKDILNSLWGQIVFIGDMIVSMYIIFLSLQRGGE